MPQAKSNLPRSKDDERTVRYPVKKDIETTAGEEKTVEYPLPYKEMEERLKARDNLMESISKERGKKDGSTPKNKQ